MIPQDSMILISLRVQTPSLQFLFLNEINYLQTSKLQIKWAEEIKSSLSPSLARGLQVVKDGAKQELDDNY